VFPKTKKKKKMAIGYWFGFGFGQKILGMDVVLKVKT
jgi:hypothetical protein